MSTNNTAIRAGNVVHNQNNFEIERSSVEFQSCGAILRGIFLTPKGKKEALPVIVMAPGMSGVKEGSIMKYAEYFARGGFAVLAYDNINFGESGEIGRAHV
jgi:dienelactone hydrolase